MCAVVRKGISVPKMTAIMTNANHWNPATTGVARTCIRRSLDRDLVAVVFEFRNITFGGAFS
jgi:hypothetical protein